LYSKAYDRLSLSLDACKIRKIGGKPKNLKRLMAIGREILCSVLAFLQATLPTRFPEAGLYPF